MARSLPTLADVDAAARQADLATDAVELHGSLCGWLAGGALFSWCRGFLGGFGLAAGHAPPLSVEGREALADLARLAAATPQENGDQEDEEALAEIEEFVRVAVLLLHGDCVLAPRHRQRFN